MYSEHLDVMIEDQQSYEVQSSKQKGSCCSFQCFTAKMKLLLLVTFLALAELDYKRRSAQSCPDRCSCSFEPSSVEVVCSKGGLTVFPTTGLPSNTTSLSIQNTNLGNITAGDLNAVQFLNNLQLYHTNLANLSSDMLVFVPHLDTLDLTGNKLVELPANLFSHSSLRSLVVKNNQLKEADTAWFSNNSSLLYLDLSGNRLTRISAALLHKLPLLQTLDLDSNNLQELQADLFRSLHQLETLNLAGNKLITLRPQIFAHNLKLKYLYLQENQLQDLPANLLHRLQHLELLLLNQNRLRHLPAGLLDGINPSLQIILTGNPWECNDKMEYLMKWLTNHRQNVLFEEELTCDLPKTLKNLQISSLTDSQLGVRLQ
ncbi:hypothetical protein CHARACLAT_008331 [Characodon lateralis]|uniref:LRRCT domain-containing protein n=1 Tax=Characodon lateralis TaxID=208331 RepID=A0ABU7CYZ8_9TELE|nr:hypothetical protein [Characodon lateralis]